MGRKAEHCIYRYKHCQTGEVFYIGKTDASLRQRIEAHAKEEKFTPYLQNLEVEFFRLQNKTETDIAEKYLINRYKPLLNEKDNREGLTDFVLTLPEWESYEVYQERTPERELTKKKLEAVESFQLYQLILKAIMKRDGSVLLPKSKFPFFLYKGQYFPLFQKECRMYPNGIRYFFRRGEQRRLVQHRYSLARELWLPLARANGCTEETEAWSFYRKFKEFLWEGCYEISYPSGIVSPKGELKVPISLSGWFQPLASEVRDLGTDKDYCLMYFEESCKRWLSKIEEAIAREELQHWKREGLLSDISFLERSGKSPLEEIPRRLWKEETQEEEEKFFDISILFEEEKKRNQRRKSPV